MLGDKVGEGGVNKPLVETSLLEEESGTGVVGLSPFRLPEGVLCEGWVVCEVEFCELQRPPVLRPSCSVLMLGLPGRGEGVTMLFNCWITARPLCARPPVSPARLALSPALLCLPAPLPSSCLSLSLSHPTSSSSSPSLSLARSDEADTLSSVRRTSSNRRRLSGGAPSGSDLSRRFLLSSDWTLAAVNFSLALVSASVLAAELVAVFKP